MRIQKYLAQIGKGSRREIEDWIRDGRIFLNGERAELGEQLEEGDELIVDDETILVDALDDFEPKLLVYHKPVGEVCTRTDPEGRPTVFDRLPPLQGQRWVVMGRLDINTSGLLLFSTEGDFANRVMHPSSQIEREYAVRVYGQVNDGAIKALKEGVQLEDGLARFKRIEYRGGEGENHWYHVVLCEGKNREVRRMWETQGVQVSRLIRIRFGHILLSRELRAGQTRLLNDHDMFQLSEQIGVQLKRRTGLYGRAKVRTEAARSPDNNPSTKKGGFLRRRRT